jgi:hypothetical protein
MTGRGIIIAVHIVAYSLPPKEAQWSPIFLFGVVAKHFQEKALCESNAFCPLMLIFDRHIVLFKLP